MFEIGEWVRRPGKTTKWHLVESIIDGDAVTRCGLRMNRTLDPVTGIRQDRELQVSPVQPLTRAIGQPQLCKRSCS